MGTCTWLPWTGLRRQETSPPESLKRSSRDSGEDEADFRKLPWPSSGVLRESAKQTFGALPGPFQGGAAPLGFALSTDTASSHFNTAFAWRRPTPVLKQAAMQVDSGTTSLCTSETG